MGCEIAEAMDATVVSSPSSGSTSDALLYTTMCMIGLPVQVQVRDGSIFSGIFHTACFLHNHGVVLKKAKLEKKGKDNANLACGAVIDTLVILSGDLVQVVAKGLLLPADGVVVNGAGNDVETVMGSIHPQAGDGELERDPKALKSGKVASKRFAIESTPEIDRTRSVDHNAESISSHALTKTNTDGGALTSTSPKPLETMPEVDSGMVESVCRAKIKEDSADQVVSCADRQAGNEKPQLEEDVHGAHKNNIVHELPSSSSSTSCHFLPNSINGRPVEMSADRAECFNRASPLIAPESSDDAVSSSIRTQSSDLPASNASTSDVDIISALSSGPFTSPTVLAPSNNKVCDASTKEFKLNPGAKTFSPSFANPRSASPPPSTISSMGYVPNSSPVLPVTGVHPGVEIGPFVPRPSLPVKFVQYNNLVSGNNGSGSQYSLPTVGHVGARQQLVRYGGQFQTGPAYVHPNPQTVMVGRLGQVVYVHPIPQDSIQGAAALSQVSARPLLTPHQAYMSKHQGTAAQALQLCTTPIVAAAQQPFSVQSQVPYPQPYPTFRPLSLPGSNGVFSSKFE